MAFRKKYQKIMELQPDLLVLQECEHEAKLKEHLSSVEYNQLIWYGKNPHKGVAVLSFNNVEIALSEQHNEDIEYVLPLKLSMDNREINLFAIWAMPHHESRAKSYVGQVWAAINYYVELLEEDSILIGDFNSNAIWDQKRKVGNHTQVMNFLKESSIYSVYHQLTDTQHGQEDDPTLYLTKNIDKPYHMDYCCASQRLIGQETSIEIGAYQDWIKLSDHMPLIIDNIV
jgi:exonuclease III